jgi:hypothetical protein
MQKLIYTILFCFFSWAAVAQNAISGVWYSPKTVEIFVITKGKTPQQAIDKIYYAQKTDKFANLTIVSQKKENKEEELMTVYYQTFVKNNTESFELDFLLSVAGEILQRRRDGKRADFGLLSAKFNENAISTSTVKSYVTDFLLQHSFSLNNTKLTFKGSGDAIKVNYEGKEADVKLSPNGQIISFNIAPWGNVKARLRVEGVWMLDIHQSSDDKKVASLIAD